MFQKPSTRTRSSFETGVFELGGHPMIVRANELQLTRGESVRDTALVFSRHVAAIGLRTGSEDELRELATYASVPVINMLSPLHHPCQALADLQTLREAYGDLEGRVLAYVGDGNNVARSLAIVGALAGLEVRIAAPNGYQLEDVAGAILTDDPAEAVAGADAVYTDVWVSMSDDEDSAAARRQALAPYRIDDALLDRAAPQAFALHCLPAHPGEEITEAVLYGDRQRIWDQAENRRHAQKALLELLVR
jgi:ornithine carbamoyltransferase